MENIEFICLSFASLAFLMEKGGRKLQNFQTIVTDGILQGFSPRFGPLMQNSIHGVDCEQLQGGTITVNDGKLLLPEEFIRRFCNEDKYCIYIRALDECIQLQSNKKYDCDLSVF